MNNTDLIDKLVTITDLATEKADQNWDFEQIQKIEEWEEEIIEALQMLF